MQLGGVESACRELEEGRGQPSESATATNPIQGRTGGFWESSEGRERVWSRCCRDRFRVVVVVSTLRRSRCLHRCVDVVACGGKVGEARRRRMMKAVIRKG